VKFLLEPLAFFRVSHRQLFEPFAGDYLIRTHDLQIQLHQLLYRVQTHMIRGIDFEPTNVAIEQPFLLSAFQRALVPNHRVYVILHGTIALVRAMLLTTADQHHRVEWPAIVFGQNLFYACELRFV